MIRITSPEGIERLKVVKQQILSEPSRFDMGFFHIESACGTSSSCICGYLNLNDGHKYEGKNRIDYGDTEHACKLLGIDSLLDDSEEDPAAIFYDCDWPSPYKESYLEVEDDLKARAQVAADFIDYLIAGGEF